MSLSFHNDICFESFLGLKPQTRVLNYAAFILLRFYPIYSYKSYRAVFHFGDTKVFLAIISYIYYIECVVFTRTNEKLNEKLILYDSYIQCLTSAPSVFALLYPVTVIEKKWFIERDDDIFLNDFMISIFSAPATRYLCCRIENGKKYDSNDFHRCVDCRYVRTVASKLLIFQESLLLFFLVFFFRYSFLVFPSFFTLSFFILHFVVVKNKWKWKLTLTVVKRV